MVARHSLWVVAAWAVLLPLVLLGSARFASGLVDTGYAVTGSESQHATDLESAHLGSRPPEHALVVLRWTTQPAPEQRTAQVSAVLAALRATPGAGDPVDPSGQPGLGADDGRTLLVPVSLTGSDDERRSTSREIQRRLDALAGDGATATLTGSTPLYNAANDVSNSGLEHADAVALPIALLVLLVAFGSVLAAVLPLVLGGLAVVVATGLLGALTGVVKFDLTTQTAVVMLSIALGIDYALFLTTRFREELAAVPRETDRVAAKARIVHAVGRTTATAGHAVMFSGMAVIVAMSSMLLVRSEAMRGMAFGLDAAVAAMLLLALTLLPAVLALLGDRINALPLPFARRRLAHPDLDRSVWARIASVSLRHPVLVAVTCLAGLGLLAAPALRLSYGVAGVQGGLADTPAGSAYVAATHVLPPGSTSPLEVVAVDGGRLTASQAAAVASFAAWLGHDPEVASVQSLPVPDGSGAVISAITHDDATSDAAAALVARARAHSPVLRDAGLDVAVGGSPAAAVDSLAENDRGTPLVLVAVLLLSALVLLVAFRSLLLPVKAVFMNLCTVAAAFGVMVMAFQEGWGSSWTHLGHVGFVEIFIPLITLPIVFGLSMDYEVFMLSRMRERWLETGDNVDAVRTGVVHTARVITAAATIMVVVFASFLLVDVADVQQMGLMLAVAVLLDATVVRLFLVPSLMRLMGRWNWWFPGRGSPVPAIAPALAATGLDDAVPEAAGEPA